MDNVALWTLADKASPALTENLIAATRDKQRVHPGQLTVHANRTGSMASKTVPAPA
ncbi:hypothetical protein FRAHR75_430021 [Frankia sp. Hr75.2]|nr:hypothetical protein FRAHR75_430021 [Frankia sp. Hr75.2]